MAVTKLGNVTPGAASQLLVMKHTFTAAQIRILNTSQQLLVPAPGAGKFVSVERMVVTKTAGTAFGSVAAGDDLFARYDGTGGANIMAVETVGFLTLTATATRAATPAGGTASTITPSANQLVELASATTFTNGSTCHIDVYYRILDMPA